MNSCGTISERSVANRPFGRLLALSFLFIAIFAGSAYAKAAVLNVTSPDADATYKAGAVINITVTFNESVGVLSGTPTLTLNTGTIKRNATYSSGSVSNTLTFTYTVVAGDNSSDLDYLNTTALQPVGSIGNFDTGSANLTLVEPGAEGSLSFNKAIVIDTISPTISAVNT
ncbi:TPA: hypothetical protein HA243_05755, partial [Candidatus Micrarchaeota archaeon]|nr:hypothetical protein [Candidatus Micrarchaeota archaeon]